MKGGNKNTQRSGGDASHFECHICLEIARNPVVTDCGHLFCWPCLEKWMRVPRSPRNCPVCKTAVEIETDATNVTPIYGCQGLDSPEDSSRLPAKRSRRVMERQLLDKIGQFADIPADRFLEDLAKATEGILREYSRRGVGSDLHMAVVSLITNSSRRVVEESPESGGVYLNTRWRTRRRIEREARS